MPWIYRHLVNNIFRNDFLMEEAINGCENVLSLHSQRILVLCSFLALYFIYLFLQLLSVDNLVSAPFSGSSMDKSVSLI
jgi:hypothetical protein